MVSRHLLDDHRGQPSGRLVQQDERGLPIRVRAMVSICCSPPDICAADRSRMRAEIGEKRDKRSTSKRARRRRAGVAPTVEILLDAELGEDAPILRHVAHAHPRDAIGARGR